MIDPNTALTVGIPTLAVLIGIFVNNNRLTDLRAHMDSRFSDMKEMIDAGFDTVNARFDTAHAQLMRVEQVMDARLKYLEERAR